MRRRLARFLTDETASLSVETVIIMPILAFIYVGSFVYYDAYRGQNVSAKASYTVGDILSRQTRTITSDDIKGLEGVFEYITGAGDEAWIRVSSVQRTAAGHIINWSYATDENPTLRNEDLPDNADKIPDLVLSERIIVVETFHPFTPAFNVGLRPRTYTNFVVTRPRFASQLPFQVIS